MTTTIKEPTSSERLELETAPLLELASDNIKLAVDPWHGGRVTGLFLHDGEEGWINLLSGPDVDKDNFGITFWPSPQAGWKPDSWPPSEEQDKAPYSAMQVDNSIIVQSPPDENNNVMLTKEFSIGEEGIINVCFKITNLSEDPQSLAPWIVARVPVDGLALFHRQEGTDIHGKNGFNPADFSTDVNTGIAWYKDEAIEDKEECTLTVAFSAKEKGKENREEERFDEKEICWTAYVHDGHALIIKFPAVSPEQCAEGEGSVLFFENPVNGYNELEAQGAIEAIGPNKGIQPKNELEWNIQLIAANVPPEVNCDIGSSDLVKYIRNLVAQAKINSPI